METKICTKCKKEFPLTKEYFKWRKDTNKFRNECIECIKKYQEEYRNKHREKNKKYAILYRKENKNKYRKQMKICYEKHRKQRIEGGRNYYYKNKKEILNKAKEYYQENKNRINIYNKNKYKNDTNYKIRCNISSRMGSIFKTQRVNKNNAIFQLLGCSIEFYKEYLESLFTEGMTWEKFMNGEIHIDHILALKEFDLRNSEEQEIAFVYWNTQPLWKVDNLSKGSKII